MTPPSPASATAAATGFRWNSPIPYLFGGLAVMLILIAFALVILVCSYKKPYSSTNSSLENGGTYDHDEKQSVPEFHMELPVEMVPKIVMMPGETNPTYLAKPALPTGADHHLPA